MKSDGSKAPRRYRMRERAISTAATRQRILDAARDFWLRRWYDEMTLKEIAAAAGVALQTVVNHFGTKDAIFAATLDEPSPPEWTTRTEAAIGDVADAVRRLVADYEVAGDGFIRGLALEDRIPILRPGLDRGRKEHRAWVRRTFAAALSGLEGTARQRRLDLLVCATDVYTWKLLRRDRGLSQAQTAKAMRELVEALHR